VELDPLFLSEEEVIELHAEQIRLFGGREGMRDQSGGLSSAVASPQNILSYVEDATLFDLAAAYAAHISACQAFVDGNKRTGMQAAISFLKVNGYRVEGDVENLFEWMMNLDCGKATKETFAVHLRQCSVREGGLVQRILRFFSPK
jgi:death-on-curing protein